MSSKKSYTMQVAPVRIKPLAGIAITLGLAAAILAVSVIANLLFTLIPKAGPWPSYAAVLAVVIFGIIVAGRRGGLYEYELSGKVLTFSRINRGKKTTMFQLELSQMVAFGVDAKRTGERRRLCFEPKRAQVLQYQKGKQKGYVLFAPDETMTQMLRERLCGKR